MKAHLLYADRDFDVDATLPPHHGDLEQDLDLGTLLGAMANGDKFIFDVSRKVLLASLGNPEEIRYRQQVLLDCMSHPDVIREMYALVVTALSDKRAFFSYRSSSPHLILHGAVQQLGAFVVRLRQLRKIADDHAAEFSSLGMRTFFRIIETDLDDGYFATLDAHLDQLHFRSGELMSARLDRDNSGIDYVLHAPRAGRARWKERLGLGPRTSYTFSVHPRDEAGSQELSDITSRGLNLVANAAAQAADHIESYFMMLRAELAFYVGCLNLHDLLAEKALPTTLPEPSTPEPFGLVCSGLCDVSLALQLAGHVVGNDVEADDTPLVIITGANSGGKSTFLRSVGTAQLMMQCGMFVVADSFRASVSTGVFTHFIREEDATMRSGRLDEELRRMDALATQLSSHCLVLFNESFAATNEREGSEIGRQVVHALLEAHVRIFFVTHQFDLADSFKRESASSTLFLRAERGPDGRRSYKLVVADPLPTSYGADVYRRIGGWLNERDEDAPAPRETARA